MPFNIFEDGRIWRAPLSWVAAALNALFHVLLLVWFVFLFLASLPTREASDSNDRPSEIAHLLLVVLFGAVILVLDFIQWHSWVMGAYHALVTSGKFDPKRLQHKWQYRRVDRDNYRWDGHPCISCGTFWTVDRAYHCGVVDRCLPAYQGYYRRFPGAIWLKNRKAFVIWTTVSPFCSLLNFISVFVVRFGLSSEGIKATPTWIVIVTAVSTFLAMYFQVTLWWNTTRKMLLENSTEPERLLTRVASIICGSGWLFRINVGTLRSPLWIGSGSPWNQGSLFANAKVILGERVVTWPFAWIPSEEERDFGEHFEWLFKFGGEVQRAIDANSGRVNESIELQELTEAPPRARRGEVVRPPPPARVLRRVGFTSEAD